VILGGASFDGTVAGDHPFTIPQRNALILQNDIAGTIIQATNTAAKLLSAMRQNPHDWAMGNLLTLANQYGMEVRSTGGSHHVFRILR